jgi:hypothetical protein
MNCDRVFDILTRGPFPTGTSIDATVESHLIRCADCRRLAGALQPSFESMAEGVSPDESTNLPGYWGELFVAPQRRSTARTRQVKRAALRKEVRRRPTPVVRSPSNVWRFAAAMVLGVVLGLVLDQQRSESHWGSDGHLIPDTATAAAEVPAGAASTNSVPAVAALGIPTACIQAKIRQLDLPEILARMKDRTTEFRDAALRQVATDGSPRVEANTGSDSLDQVGCCTQCHSSAKRLNTSEAANHQIAASCTQCHK